MPDPVTGSVVVFDQSDNETRLELRNDNVAIGDHTSVDRLVITFSGVQVDSDVSPQFFDLTNAAYVGVKLGLSNLRKGQHHARVVTYDLLHPNGICWDDALPVSVR